MQRAWENQGCIQRATGVAGSGELGVDGGDTPVGGGEAPVVREIGLGVDGGVTLGVDGGVALGVDGGVALGVDGGDELGVDGGVEPFGKLNLKPVRGPAKFGETNGTV